MKSWLATTVMTFLEMIIASVNASLVKGKENSRVKTRCKLNWRIKWNRIGHMHILFMFNLSCVFTGSTWSLKIFATEVAARICSVRTTVCKTLRNFLRKNTVDFPVKLTTKLKRNLSQRFFLGNFAKVFMTALKNLLQISLLILDKFKRIN